MSVRDDLEALGIDLRWRRTGNIKTLCPRCSHLRKKRRDPCLSVDVDRGVWKCHNPECGWSGKVGKDEQPFRDYGPPARPKKVYRKPAVPPEGDLSPGGWAFFEKRGIERGALVRNRVHSDRTVMPGDEPGTSSGVVVFPYFKDGEHVNSKFRTADKRFRMVAGAELCLYKYDDIPADGLLYWVEGEVDCLALESIGITACVSPPNGAPPVGSDYRGLRECLEGAEAKLAGVTWHILAGDADGPGKALQDELVRRLGPEKCLIVTWPNGRKDANEVLVHEGAGALQAALADARPVPVAGLFEPDDLAADIDALYEQGLTPGEHPGWDGVAGLYTVKPGQLTVLSGVPSHGKSLILDNLLVNLAERVGWSFAVCSPENQPLARHAAQFMQIHAGKPFGQGPIERMTVKERDQARRWLQEHFRFILPPDDEWTVDHILDKARVAVYRDGIRGLVLDPWNELEHERPRGQSETEYISEALTRIRRFARLYGVHVWVVAHPMKLQKDAQGNYPVPTLYDISGSAHWRNKADMGVVIWRDVADEAGATQVHVQKVRFPECGRVGMAELVLDKPTTRFHEPRRSCRLCGVLLSRDETMLGLCDDCRRGTGATAAD